MTAKPKPTFSWTALDSLRTQVGISEDVIPDEAFTIDQYVERYNVGHKTAFSQLKSLQAKGKVKSGRKLVATDGQVRWWRFYWTV